MRFAVIGGDERQARLARQLARDGAEVRAFALEAAPLPPEIERAADGAEAAAGADCTVLPLPVSVKKGYLNAPLSPEARCLGEVFGALPPGALVCAGMPSGEVRALAGAAGVRLRDYYAREELLARNAVATAEGALGVLLRETDRTLWGRRILIVGWGRIGRALAPRLRALGAEVAVSARRAGDLAWIEAGGARPLDTRSLEGNLSGFDLVVNTVPALVLGMSRLAELPPGALVLDLASRPGGVDREAAQVLGIRALWEQGLPGRWAPETAADAVREAVYHILEEEQEHETGT